jgi:predicted ATPase
MGIHTGEGRLDADGEYVGADVHRAARVGAAGHGGQVLLSETTSALVADELPPGVSIQSLGRHRLKDLRPEQICQLVVDGLRSEFPPIRSLDARPNNLPTQLTSFVGREIELREAADLLASTRLLTLTGPGGTGKTRLSLQVAADVAERFPGGVWFVALEPIRDPALIASRIAGTIGIVEIGGRTARDLLVEWLGEREVLLVLDNFEQVIAGAPLVADLLRSAPRLSVLVTSRAALRVSGEQEYPVPGLPVPVDVLALSELEKLNLRRDERQLAAETITQFEAVRLFIARAVAVRPDFTVTNENAPAVAGICARLHGMPLAIELAAARIKLLAPDAILARLENLLGILAAGSRDLPERQQTLRGAIAWSYDLLGEAERRLFWRLAIFVGGCDLEAAEAVCGPPDEVGGDLLDGLMALVDQSLVKTDDIDGTTRFRLLDTIREFASERLAESGERPEIERRHTATYAKLVASNAPELAGERQREALGRIERDHDNIRAMLDRTVAAPEPAVALTAGAAMWRYWQKRGHLAEAHRRLAEIAERPWSRDDPTLRARLMEALGGVGWWRADAETMNRAYAEALEVWRSMGDRKEIANALYNASFKYALDLEADDGSALAMLEEALALYRDLDDEHGEANVLWAIGNYHYVRGDPDQGVDWFREALPKFSRSADRTMEAWGRHMLGSALIRRGEKEEAGEPLRAALRHFHGAGDVSGIALVLDDLAAEAVAFDDLPRSARLWGAARALSTAGGVALADFYNDHWERENRPSAVRAMEREELERHAAEGRAMSLDEAVAYALDMPVEDLPGPHEHTGRTPR